MSQPNSRTSSPDIAKAASLAKAVSLHMEGKLDEALAEINRVLETAEGTLEIFSAKAQIQFELEMYEEAAQSYAKLLSMHPKHANANLNLAVCLERLGRWQEAADFFEKAAEAQPDRVDAGWASASRCCIWKNRTPRRKTSKRCWSSSPITPPRCSAKP